MGKRKAKTDAAKQADFTRLAEKHTNTIIAAFARLAKLGNANKYASTPAQLKKITEAVAAAANAAQIGLEGKGTVSGAFKL